MSGVVIPFKPSFIAYEKHLPCLVHSFYIELSMGIKVKRSRGKADIIGLLKSHLDDT